jgi:hypothetical protein
MEQGEDSHSIVSGCFSRFDDTNTCKLTHLMSVLSRLFSMEWKEGLTSPHGIWLSLQSLHWIALHCVSMIRFQM